MFGNKAIGEGTTPKFRSRLLFLKSDTATVDKIKATSKSRREGEESLKAMARRFRHLLLLSHHCVTVILNALMIQFMQTLTLLTLTQLQLLESWMPILIQLLLVQKFIVAFTDVLPLPFMPSTRMVIKASLVD